MFVQDWKDCWKWLSMWGGVAVAIWGGLSDAQRAWVMGLLPGSADNITMALGVFIVVVRVLKQSTLLNAPAALVTMVMSLRRK